MKIYGNILILLILSLLSCKTVSVDNFSNEIIEVVQNENKEYKLPYIDDIKPIDIYFSNIIKLPTPSNNNEVYTLPVLSYMSVEKSWFSNEITYIQPLEYSLPYLPMPKKEVVVKKIVKPTIIEKKVEIVEKVATIKPVVIKPVIVEPKITNSKIEEEKETKASEYVPQIIVPIDTNNENIHYLDDMEVVTGKSFTIAMDLTGWLYENEQDDLLFKNKFYTSDKVLFEFIAEKSGLYNIEFSKYTDEAILYSRVKVLVTNREEIVPSEHVDEELIIETESVQNIKSEKSRLEEALLHIDTVKDPDEIYYKLGQIYFDEGLLKKSKEYFEYVYDNYPLSIYYDESKDKMNYIINNFLKRR